MVSRPKLDEPCPRGLPSLIEEYDQAIVICVLKEIEVEKREYLSCLHSFGISIFFD